MTLAADIEGATTTAKLTALADRVEDHDKEVHRIRVEFATLRTDIRAAITDVSVMALRWVKLIVLLAVTCTLALGFLVVLARH